MLSNHMVEALSAIADHLWKHRDLGWIAMQLDAFKIDYNVASPDDGSEHIDAERAGPPSGVSTKSLPNPTSSTFSKKEQRDMLIRFVKSYGKKIQRYLNRIHAWISASRRLLRQFPGPFPRALPFDPFEEEILKHATSPSRGYDVLYYSLGWLF